MLWRSRIAAMLRVPQSERRIRMDYLTFGPRVAGDPDGGFDLCCSRGCDFVNDFARKSHMKRYHPTATRFEVRDTCMDALERAYVRVGGKWVIE